MTSLVNGIKTLRSRAVTLPRSIRPRFNNRVVELSSPSSTLLHTAVSCQTKFSLNYRLYMGRTDGENIERRWAWLNPASLSTHKMGPGARQDALDDQWSFWNWRILVKLGMFMALLCVCQANSSPRHNSQKPVRRRNALLSTTASVTHRIYRHFHQGADHSLDGNDG